MGVRRGYKQTEAGVVPEDWLDYTIGDLIDFEGGSQPDKSVFRASWKPGFIRLIQIRDYKTDKFETYIPSNLARRFCSKTDIMIGRYGPPIFQILRGLSGAYNVALIKARPLPQLNQSFAYYFLKQERLFQFIEKLSQRTSGQTGIDIKELRGYPFPLPPTKGEQEAIAEALSDADALIESLEQLITKKRQIKQGAMQALLTGKKRLPGFSGEWEPKRLGELGSFLKGSGVSKDQSLSGNLACVRYGEIYTRHNDYVKTFQSWISRDVAATATRLKYGDILFAGSGETKEDIGKSVAFVHDEEAYAGGDIIILRTEKAAPLFLGYYLNTASINRQKASRGQGDAVVHISATSLSEIQGIFPTMSEQKAIAEILSDMGTEITILEIKLNKARQIKQGMMQELLTGKTRLV